MNRSIKLFVLLVCMVCYGCKTISTNVMNINSNIPYREIKTIAVMRFDDKYVQGKAVTGFLLKTVSNPDAGELLADIMTNELLKWGKYRVLTRPEIKSKLKTKKLKEEELVKSKDFATIEKILKIDAVILGKIDTFELSNMTIYERGNVSFTAECIDVKNGKTLWSMETNESAPYKDELELADKAVKEAVEKLRKE